MRGTTYEQDPRYKDKEAKQLASINWPLEYSLSVNIKKVNLDVVKPWITKQTTEILGLEDEILDNLIISSLEDPELCPKKLQILITGFLEQQTPRFVLKLWRLLISAQENQLGIPRQIIDERREDLLKKKRELEKNHDQLAQRSGKKREKERKSHLRSRSRSLETREKGKYRKNS